jgi:lipopolysaccharide transport system ATP-binding protein
MSKVIIQAEKIGKKYQLGGPKASYSTFRETLMESAQAPLRWLKGERKKIDTTFWALDDVSFEINYGEAVGIIGRNGAGKSTLLKILSRITKPTRGRVDLFGRVGSLLEVGTGFHPELTGRENIFLNGAILGMSRQEIAKKYDEIIDFAEVEKFLDTPVKFYSSGMYVRLAFAVAAHLDPEILVVDEVLAVGDAAFQRKCLGKLGENAESGRTVLFVSHNMAAINRLCRRALLLDKGRLIADGPATEITAKYLAGAAEENGVREWNANEAPGTQEVRLIKVSLQSNDGTAKSVFDVSEEISMRLVYQVGVANTSFRCSLVFKTQGTAAFSSIEPTELNRPEVGIYCSVVKIPAHLLAESEYSVNISAFTSSGGKKHYLSLREAIYFQVYDSMTGPSARGDYAQNLAGVVRPFLKWETSTTRIDEK